MDTCTFIIPTMGRKLLDRAMQSLLDQTFSNWKALVLFDSRYEPDFTTEDPRITVIRTEIQGHAGNIRNIGIDLVDTDWMAFLDDDDYLDKQYLEALVSYTNSNKEWDVIIFTYKDVVTGRIIPPRNTNKFEECRVGISFAAKTDFIRKNNIKFTPYSIEDFRFLDTCRSLGGKILITNDIRYYVDRIGGWLKND